MARSDISPGSRSKQVHQNVLDERARNVLTLVNRCALAKIPEHVEEKSADQRLLFY